MDSVIRALESESHLRGSSVCGRALVVRAELHQDVGRYEEAIRVVEQEALPLIESLGSAAVASSLASRAYRIAAESYEKMGKIPEAIRCLQQWSAADSSFQTKINKEIQRLKSSVR